MVNPIRVIKRKNKHQTQLKRDIAVSTASVLLLVSLMAQADNYPLPPDDIDVIGEMEVTTASASDTLLDIARKYNLGLNAITLANPNVDKWLPGENTPVILSRRHILPDAPRQGIVLNIAEMRLYYYANPKAKKAEVITHPVSIGRVDWTTPLGTAKVVTKTKDPVWRPPKSIKEEHAANGDILPDVVPAGPDNPLGKYAMRLSIPGYLIHSTNKPYGIGMRVTHGCVRMYPEDIEKLFDDIPVGERVTIVNQPVKLGWLMNQLYIEIYPQIEENQEDTEAYDYSTIIERSLQQMEKHAGEFADNQLIIDGSALREALEKKNGIPTKISRNKTL